MNITEMLNEKATWKTDEGVEFSMSAQDILDRYGEVYANGKKYKLDTKEALYLRSLFSAHRLNPHLDGYFVPRDNSLKFVVYYMFILQRVGKFEFYDGYDAPKDIIDDQKNYSVEVAVWRKDRSRPTVVTVDWNEFALIIDGRPKGMWAKKPKFMLRKVAIAMAHRLAFAAELKGLFIQEEFDQDNKTVSSDKKTPTQIKTDINSEIRNLMKCKTSKDLEMFGNDLAKRIQSYSASEKQKLRSKYLDKKAELEKETNEESIAIQDFRIQDEVIDKLKDYTPERHAIIMKEIEKIKDSSIRQVLIDKIRELSNLSLKEGDDKKVSKKKEKKNDN